MLKAIIPRIEEVIGYFVVGLLAVVALNVTGIIEVLYAVSQTGLDVQQIVSTSFVGLLSDIAQPLNGRLGNSVIWATMGILAFCLGSIAVAELQDLFDHEEQAKVTSSRFRSTIWTEFVIRSVLRLLAIVGLITWVYLFVATVSPYVSRLMLNLLLADPVYLWGVVGVLIGGILFGLSFYTAALLCRFIALRVRVFSKESWVSTGH